jgi:hypothetical protein
MWGASDIHVKKPVPKRLETGCRPGKQHLPLLRAVAWLAAEGACPGPKGRDPGRGPLHWSNITSAVRSACQLGALIVRHTVHQSVVKRRARVHCRVKQGDQCSIACCTPDCAVVSFADASVCFSSLNML